MIHIRTGTEADLETVVAFNRAMALETEGKDLGDRVAQGCLRALRDPSRAVYYLAALGEGGDVVGQLMVTPEWSDWRDGWFWWLQSLYVAPSARGIGVYRALYAHVYGLARATPDVCGLRGYVAHENPRALVADLAMGLQRAHYDLVELDFAFPNKPS